MMSGTFSEVELRLSAIIDEVLGSGKTPTPVGSPEHTTKLVVVSDEMSDSLIHFLDTLQAKNMKSLTSALLRRRRTTTKIGNTDLGPSWPEAWRRTKGQHSLPGAVLSLFPTGTMREMLAVNQLRKGGFNGTIRYL